MRTLFEDGLRKVRERNDHTGRIVPGGKTRGGHGLAGRECLDASVSESWRRSVLRIVASRLGDEPPSRQDLRH